MSSEVLLVQGTSIQISTSECTDVNVDPLPVMATLDCIAREITVTGGTATENDVTTLCSTAKEFRMGLSDAGTMSVTGHWKIGNAAHEAIREASEDKLRRLIIVTFEDLSTWKCLAFVSQRSWAAAVDGIVTATYSFRLTGEPVEAPAPVVPPAP
jgi:hypothetical protein